MVFLDKIPFLDKMYLEKNTYPADMHYQKKVLKMEIIFKKYLKN